MPAPRCCRRFSIVLRRKQRSWPWGILMWHKTSPRYRTIFALFPMPASRKSARPKLFLARSPFMVTCRSAFPTSLNVAPAWSARHKSQRRHRNMRTTQPLNDKARLALALVLAFGILLALPGCSVNVKKNGEGQEKKVDIETPLGALHVSKDADVRDIGLPVYPGARRKEHGEGDHDNNAHVNISSSLFGLKVVAIEYLSDDPPEKIIAFYKDQLKRYGEVLECHNNSNSAGAIMNPGDHSGHSERL